MRAPALVLLILSLTACGGGGGGGNAAQPGSEAWAKELIGNEGSPGFERADGSFDRADYRRVMVPGCAAGMRDGGPTIPVDAIDRFCACLVDGVLAANSDDRLRAMRRDEGLQTRAFDAATESCRPALAGGRPAASGDAPPPEEPPPAPPGQAGTPPPVVQEVPR